MWLKLCKHQSSSLRSSTINLMKVDKAQQARLTFLTEAETYFEQIEAVLLSLKTADDRSNQINIAMRAAHSVKGTAAMMGFFCLSQIAHSLEDYFKILQARQLPIDSHLETLLLQVVDCLRMVRLRHCQELSVEPRWLAIYVEPILAQLNQRLGELTSEDEAWLLSTEAEEDLDVVIFTTSVEDCLDEFESDLARLSGEDLRQAMLAMAGRLSEFGLMAQLDAFVELCQAVYQRCAFAYPEALATIAHHALKIWKRSHSLVLLNRTERLPTQLNLTDDDIYNGLSDGVSEIVNSATDEGIALPADLLVEPAVFPDILGISPDNIYGLENQPTTLDIAADISAGDISGLESSFDARQAEPSRLEELQAKFEALQLAAAPEVKTPSPIERSGAPDSHLDIPAVPEDHPRVIDASADVSLVPLSEPPNRSEELNSGQTSMVRVAVEQLQQINNLFEALILNRNAINLRFGQLQSFSALMQERMAALASFNTELRRWYDRAATEGLGPESWAPGNGGRQGGNLVSVSHSRVSTLGIGEDNSVAEAAPTGLDALEFDRYSKLHLLAQEHMETMVKLEEVGCDIELGLNDMGQAISDLGFTSQALKTRITQTQMRSFAEIVGPFPRVVRDWSVQYGKPVNLKIEGEATLLEQFALDRLSDPLMHLLRNAFDHGVESPEIRQAQQKPAVGTITLRAANRGNRVVVRLSDDGGGIDLARVRDRIRQYNLPDEQVDGMSRQEVLSFIFEPGFSTTSKVTELSGRGFGMDVVRANLDQLHGDIQVDTKLGEGTTFTLSIPRSLSSLRVMLVEHNRLVFALPIDTVQEILRTSSLDAMDETLIWQDGLIPLIRLEDYWAVKYAARPLEMSDAPLINQPMVAVLGEGKYCYGLHIDCFWREQEVSIRPVSSPIPLPPGFSGITVLGNGHVVPLLDPMGLMEWILKQPDSPPAENGLQTAGPIPISQFNAAKILVVDDSIHARRYLAASLEKAGYLVDQAKDGREADDKLIGGLVIEAVICDIEMPRLDGYGVLEEPRERPDFSTLPIVMLTSRSSEKHRKLAMNLGATAYFSKPYNESALLQRLQQLTNQDVD